MSENPYESGNAAGGFMADLAPAVSGQDAVTRTLRLLGRSYGAILLVAGFFGLSAVTQGVQVVLGIRTQALLGPPPGPGLAGRLWLLLLCKATMASVYGLLFYLLVRYASSIRLLSEQELPQLEAVCAAHRSLWRFAVVAVVLFVLCTTALVGVDVWLHVRELSQQPP